MRAATAIDRSVAPARKIGGVAGVDEHVGHDAVLVAEMMLGEPGIVEAELVGAQDFARHARVHVAARIGLDILVGMRGEQNAEFHARALLARGLAFEACLHHHPIAAHPMPTETVREKKAWPRRRSASSASAAWASPWQRGSLPLAIRSWPTTSRGRRSAPSPSRA